MGMVRLFVAESVDYWRKTVYNFATFAHGNDDVKKERERRNQRKLKVPALWPSVTVTKDWWRHGDAPCVASAAAASDAHTSGWARACSQKEKDGRVPFINGCDDANSSENLTPENCMLTH